MKTKENIYDKIPAKPTKYKGRLYRSRLEARVAAFFELSEWKFEYEPCDLKGWSPDFFVTFNSGRSAFVEVKPLKDSFDLVKIFNATSLENYGVVLIAEESMVVLFKSGFNSFNLSQYEYWIEAANKVMFLKPTLK
jgi:hypothetical protein